MTQTMSTYKPKRSLPNVYITEDVQDQLELYIQATPGEISGLGKVEQVDDGLLVTEIYLFKQVCGSASTVLDEDAVAGFLTELIMRGVDPSQMKLWWHSHAKMKVFWSGTDDDTIDLFENGWMLSIVGNQAGKYLARLDTYEPFRLTIDNLPINVLRSYPDGLEDAIKAEVEAKVTISYPPVVRYINPYSVRPQKSEWQKDQEAKGDEQKDLVEPWEDDDWRKPGGPPYQQSWWTD